MGAHAYAPLSALGLGLALAALACGGGSDGDDVYILTTGSETTLLRWTPGQDPGETLVVVESGRIWEADLAAGTSEWLGNETLVYEWVEMSEAGVLFDTYEGLRFWERATGELRDVSQEIADAWRMNDTYAGAHYFSLGDGFTLHGTTVIYVGSYGLFAYDLEAGWLEPILLDPRDLPRIEYRDPRVLDSGVVFVKGLESESGAVGADGPIYRVEHPALMR
jgi:hypothetical protein